MGHGRSTPFAGPRSLHLLYLLLKFLSCIFHQLITLIAQWREVIARRRQADRPVRIASRGTRERWDRYASHGRPQDGPPSRREAGVVSPLRGSRGHLPARGRTSTTGCACGAGAVVSMWPVLQGTLSAPRGSMGRPLDPHLVHTPYMTSGIQQVYRAQD